MRSMSSRIATWPKLTSAVLNPLLIVAAATVMGLLLMQNLQLKQKQAEMPVSVTKKLEFYNFNFQLNKFLGKRLPVDLASIGPASASQPGGHLVMVFNPEVCGKCVRDGLQTLQEFSEVTTGSGIDLVALIGVETIEDKSYTLQLQETGELFFPFEYREADELEANFPMATESGYTDAPLYFLLNNDLVVQAAFKSEQRNPKTFHDWLALVLS